MGFKGLWGKKAEDNTGDPSALGLGPNNQAPLPNPLPYQVGRTEPNPNLTVPEQWQILTHGSDTWDPDTERIERSRREEVYGYNGSGQQSSEQRKDIHPDESYWNPPPNPRIVRKPSTVSFTREEFGRGFTGNNGNAFSMASNYRTYEIFGQAPQALRRINTLRTEPAPMDINTYDSGTPVYPDYNVFVSEVADTYGRSFRLGG